MKIRLLTLTLAALLTSSLTFAHGQENHEAKTIEAGRVTAQAIQSIAPAAVDAVAAVERFSVDLSTGNLEAAGAELDPAVLILESGGVERSRDEYLQGHAKSDAAYLKAAQITLKRRSASAAGDLAWVASESEIHAMKGEEMLMVASTETMVLRKVGSAWKIVHIHWSSRRASDKH